jgi:hypothetical protein
LTPIEVKSARIVVCEKNPVSEQTYSRRRKGAHDRFAIVLDVPGSHGVAVEVLRGRSAKPSQLYVVVRWRSVDGAH